MDVPDTVKTVVISCIGFVEKEVSVAGAEWLDVRLEKPCFFNEAHTATAQPGIYSKPAYGI